MTVDFAAICSVAARQDDPGIQPYNLVVAGLFPDKKKARRALLAAGGRGLFVTVGLRGGDRQRFVLTEAGKQLAWTAKVGK